MKIERMQAHHTFEIPILLEATSNDKNPYSVISNSPGKYHVIQWRSNKWNEEHKTEKLANINQFYVNTKILWHVHRTSRLPGMASSIGF